MTFNELADLIRSGKRPIVQFTSQIDDFDTYLIAGMRAQITKCVYDHHLSTDGDELWVFTFDLSEFTHINEDKEDNVFPAPDDFKLELVLGDYETCATETVEMFMTLISDDVLGYTVEWKESGCGKTYVEWLEDKWTFAKKELGSRWLDGFES